MLRDAKYLRFSSDLPSKEDLVPDQRPEWHDCACCPPNVMRFFSSLTHYLATRDAKGIQIHHFAPADIECDLQSGQRVKLNVVTDYPWQGQIKLRLWKQITFHGHYPSAYLNGASIQFYPSMEMCVTDLKLVKGYFVLEKKWQAGDMH